jgi:hypothetical protein
MEETTMAIARLTSVLPRSFDEIGRAVRMDEDEIRERNALGLEAFAAVAEIGDDAEQRDTLCYLMYVVDADRLSNRPRFGQ